MAFDLKKYLTPKYLLIGGAAIVVGLIVATKFRPKSETASEEEQTVIARPIAQPYGVDRDPEEYRVPVSATPAMPYTGDTAPLPAKPPISMPPKPTQPPGTKPQPQPPGTPIPIGQPPTKPPAPLPGTPRREPTPAPPGPPPAQPNVPGGFSVDCRGVLPRPHDHPGADPLILVRAKGGDRLARTIATEWAIIGIGAMPGALGLADVAAWTQLEIHWSVGNQYRRNRGLKALTKTEWAQLRDQVVRLNIQNMSKPLSDDQLRQLWNTWHIPYLCG